MFLSSSNSLRSRNLLRPTLPKSKFSFLIVHHALYSISTGRWHAIPLTNRYGEISGMVLKVVLYAHSESSSLRDRSFLFEFTTFIKMVLISLLASSSWPLGWGCKEWPLCVSPHIWLGGFQRVCSKNGYLYH